MTVRRLRPITPGMERRLELLRSWSTQLDSQFQVPGTGIRFGWDPIIGLVPGIGDLITYHSSVADYPEMFAVIGSIIAVAAITIHGLERLERRIFPPEIREP